MSPMRAADPSSQPGRVPRASDRGFIEAHHAWQVTRRYRTDVSIDELRAAIANKHTAVATWHKRPNCLSFNMIHSY